MRQLTAARSAAVMAALVLGTAAAAIAQGDGGWVGRRVITKYGTVLKVGNAVVDDEKRGTNLAVASRDRRDFRVYRVERLSGPWLRLAAEKEGVDHDPLMRPLAAGQWRNVTRNFVERISIHLEDEEARADHGSARATGPTHDQIPSPVSWRNPPCPPHDV
jgi:hypothetical protein